MCATGIIIGWWRYDGVVPVVVAVVVKERIKMVNAGAFFFAQERFNSFVQLFILLVIGGFRIILLFILTKR